MQPYTIAGLKTAAERHEYEARIVGETPPSYLDGTMVEIWKGERYIGRTTVGGLLVVGDRTLALTVKYGFWPRMVVTGYCGTRAVHRWPDPPPETPASMPRRTIGFLEYISDDENRRDLHQSPLNWALIAITHPGVKLMNRGCDWPISKNTLYTEYQICIHLPTGVVNTEVIGTTIRNDPFFPEVVPRPLIVGGNGSVEEDDAGSWAYKARDGTPLGMLIDAPRAVLINLEDIISDIINQTGLLPVIVAPNSIVEDWERKRKGTEKGEDQDKEVGPGAAEPGALAYRKRVEPKR